MLILKLQHVSSQVSGFPVASPCLWREAAKLSFLKVPKQVVMSFCVASVALPDILACPKTCRKSLCGSAAGAKLLPRFQKMSCIFRGGRSTFVACFLRNPLSGLRQVPFATHLPHIHHPLTTHSPSIHHLLTTHSLRPSYSWPATCPRTHRPSHPRTHVPTYPPNHVWNPPTHQPNIHLAT